MTVNDKWLNTKWDIRTWTEAQKITFQEECFRLGYSWGGDTKVKHTNATAYFIHNNRLLGYWSSIPMVRFDEPGFGVEKKWEDMFPSETLPEKDRWLNTSWDVSAWTEVQKVTFQGKCFRLGYRWPNGIRYAQHLHATGYAIGNNGKMKVWEKPKGDLNLSNEKKWEDMFPAKVKNDKNINHQDYYGGDNVYEVMKIIEHYNLGFKLGNVLKYVIRAGKKDPTKEIEDLEKAKVYLERQIEYLQSQGV